MQKENSLIGDKTLSEEVFYTDKRKKEKPKTKYKDAFTREETARDLGISISTLDRLIKKGDARLLPQYYKVGSQYRFLKKIVAEFKENNPFYMERFQ